jgi:hypothetical protein
MSYATYYDLLMELDFRNVEPINYHYTRVFFQNTATAQEFVDALLSRKRELELSSDTELEAKVVGKKNSLVIVKGLGSVLERSRASFDMLEGLLRRYTGAAGAGDDQTLQVSADRKKEGGEAQSSQEAGGRRLKRRTPKSAAPSGAGEPSATESDLDPLLAEGEVEESFAKYILAEEVDTLKTMAKHASDQFDLPEQEARGLLIEWAEKNAAKEVLEYDENAYEGDGLIRLHV